MTMRIHFEADSEEELKMLREFFVNYGKVEFGKDGEKKEEKKESNKERKEERKEGERDKAYNAGAEKKSEPKHKHESFQNVLLTDAELEKLREKFEDADEKIEKFSNAKAAKGYVYKSDYAAILKWHWDEPKAIPVSTLKKEYKSTYQRLKEMGAI